MYWWWDSYIDPLDLWAQFGGLSHFLEGEDLAALHRVYKSRLSGDSAGLMVLQNEQHLLAWIRNAEFDAQKSESAYQVGVREKKTPETTWKYELAAISDLQLTLAGLEDGSYQAKWYSPETSQWLTQQTIQVKDGVAILAVPAFTSDIALKVEVSK